MWVPGSGGQANQLMDRRGAALQRDGDRPDTRTLGPEGGHLLDQFVILLSRWSPQSPESTDQSSASLLRYADEAHRRSASRMVMIETGDRASIVDARRGRLIARRRIEGCDGSIRVADKSVLEPSRVRVGARDVPSLVDADPMRSR